MTSITPNSKESDVAGAIEIINLLSDKDAYNKRLVELRTITAGADAKLKEAQELREKYEAAHKMVADASARLSEHKQRGDALDAKESVLEGREKAVVRSEQELAAKLKRDADSFTERDKTVKAKEAHATARMDSADRREARLDAREADIERRETKMREIARSLSE